MDPSRTLVLYIGNPIVRNDQIGLLVGARLKHLFSGTPGLEIREFTGSPLDLITLLEGYDKAILVDSVALDGEEVGSVHLFDEEALLARQGDSYPHGMNIPEALALARRLGIAIPAKLWLIGIEVPSILEFGESLDPELAAREQQVSREVALTLRKLLAE